MRQDIRIDNAVGGTLLETRVRRLGAISVSRFEDHVRDLRCSVARVPSVENAFRLSLTAELVPPHATQTFTLQGADLERLLAHGFARLQRDLRRTLASRSAGLPGRRQT